MPETEEPQRGENILDVLSGLQNEINVLKSKNETLEKQLNQFRLGLYIPPNLEEIDIRPIATRCAFSFLDIIKQPNGLEIGMNIQRCIINLAAEVSDTIEQHRSKLSIKVRLTEDDQKKRKEVDKLRKEKSPEGKKERVLLSDAEKAVRGIIKQYPGVSQTNLLPFVKAFLPTMSDDDARGVLESLFLKLAKSKEKK